MKKQFTEWRFDDWEFLEGIPGFVISPHNYPKNWGDLPPLPLPQLPKKLGCPPHFTPLFCPKNVDFVIFDPLMGNPGFSQEGVIFFIHFTEISLHYVWSFMRNSVNTIGRLDGTCPSLAKIQLTQACLCFTITWNFLTPPITPSNHPSRSSMYALY